MRPEEESADFTRQNQTRKTPAYIIQKAPLLLSMVLFFIVMFLFNNVYHIKTTTVVNILLVSFIYLTVKLVAIKLRPDTNHKEAQHPAYQWPLSGPIHRFGMTGVTLVATITGFLSIFNPFILIQQLRQIIGQFIIAARIKGKHEQYSDYKNKVDYRLPVTDEWLIFHGGNTEETSHSWNLFTQRYAYDFVIADESFGRHQNKGNQLEDYYCYRKPIVSASDGEVVSIQNSIGAAPFVGYCFFDFLSRSFLGNHVIVKHAEGEYGFYAHLVKGSVAVKPGDHVKAGDRLGLCGHTGFSSEPHLHFHLQDRPDFFTAMGLPIEFSGIAIDGQEHGGRVSIVRGTRVAMI